MLLYIDRKKKRPHGLACVDRADLLSTRLQRGLDLSSSGVWGGKRESNGNSIIIIAQYQRGIAILLLSAVLADRRKPRAQAAPVASINFVIRHCAVLRLAKVHLTSQTNERIYQSSPSLWLCA